MNEFIDFITANTTVAYITAVVIFVITIILLIKRIIGFMITLLLLAFALLAGLAIANHDVFRDVLQSFKEEPSKPGEDRTTHIKNQLNKAYDELKKEFEEQKNKIEKMYDAYQSSSKEPKKDTIEPVKP